MSNVGGVVFRDARGSWFGTPSAEGDGVPSSAQRLDAFRLALQAMSLRLGSPTVQGLAADTGQLPWLIRGSGLAGNPAYATWLIGHMDRRDMARIAGEAFTLITGADLSAKGSTEALQRTSRSGPSDDPDDPNVDKDDDDGLPWPDGQRVRSWWDADGQSIEKGTRYFMGAPVTREHCIEVLKNGYQRQRILAAHYLCLLDPGTPLFNTSAPAWRQQRLLAEMR